MKLLWAVVALASLTACASRPRAPYVPPDTPVGRLSSVAFLPIFGAPIAQDAQDRLAATWAGWWRDVYPSARWQAPTSVGAQLLKSTTVSAWSADERIFSQTGLLRPTTIAMLCNQLQVEALMQVQVNNLQAGTAQATWLTWPFTSGQPSTAVVAISIIGCANAEPLWQGSGELTYQASYTQEKMVEYAMGAAFGRLPQ